MRILYIDNVSPIGHVQFNRIHLEALCKIGEVYTAMRKGYYEKIGQEKAKKIIEIPDYLYMPIDSKWRFLLYRIIRRILGYDSETQGTLNYVRNRVQDNWDAVIISHMESKSLSKMKPLSNIYAVCHQYNLLINNGVRFANKNNRIKYTRDVGTRYTLIALSKSMLEGIKNLKINNVQVVPHGFLPMKGTCDIKVLNKMGISPNKKILFIPSFNITDELRENIYNNKNFDVFLEVNNYLLVIKDKTGSNNNQKNVKVISSWITNSEYQTIFLASYCVILPYENQSPFRESGIIMECFANNKLCLCMDIPSMHVYDTYFNYESYFYDINSLMEKLVIYKSLKQPLYKNLDDINNPIESWCNLLNGFNI